MDILAWLRQWWDRLKRWPQSARSGLMALVAGYLWLFGVLYWHLGEVPPRILIAGIGTCLFLTTTYRWAWVLTLMGCVMTILYTLLPAIQHWDASRGTAVGYLVVVACFAAALFFLTRKESSGFFTKNFAAPEKPAEPDPPAAPEAPKTAQKSKNRKKSR